MYILIYVFAFFQEYVKKILRCRIYCRFCTQRMAVDKPGKGASDLRSNTKIYEKFTPGSNKAESYKYAKMHTNC